MTIDRAKTIEMAREAGCDIGDGGVEWLRRFAALVRAQVIEQAAQICEGRAKDHEEYAASDDGDERSLVYAKHVRRCAAAIRGMKSDSVHPAAADAGASTAPLPEGERNQCDGCARGLPVTGGLHRGEGSWDLQGCTADRYASPQQPTATARELAAMFRQFSKSSHRWHDGRSVHIVAAEVLEHFANGDSRAQLPNRPFAIVIGRGFDGDDSLELAVHDGVNYCMSDGDCFDRDGDTLDGYTAEFLTQYELEKRLDAAHRRSLAGDQKPNVQELDPESPSRVEDQPGGGT